MYLKLPHFSESWADKLYVLWNFSEIDNLGKNAVFEMQGTAAEPAEEPGVRVRNWLIIWHLNSRVATGYVWSSVAVHQRAGGWIPQERLKQNPMGNCVG